MRTILTTIVILIAISSCAQTIAINTGISYGRFYDTQKEEGHLVKNYTPQIGFYAGAEVKDIAIDTLIKIGFAINYQNYGGYFYTQNGGQGGSNTDEGEITKHILGLAFYPINLRLFKKLRISMGVSFNTLLSYRMSGNHSWYRRGSSPSNPGSSGTTDLNEIDGLVKPYYWGINSCIGYEFEVNKFIIEPRYNFYVGLSNEFDKLQTATKSLRHSFQLSIGYKIK